MFYVELTNPKDHSVYWRFEKMDHLQVINFLKEELAHVNFDVCHITIKKDNQKTNYPSFDHYGMEIDIIGGQKCIVQIIASDYDEAEQIFTSNLDSGDYDYIIQEREYTVKMIEPIFLKVEE